MGELAARARRPRNDSSGGGFVPGVVWGGLNATNLPPAGQRTPYHPVRPQRPGERSQKVTRTGVGARPLRRSIDRPVDGFRGLGLLPPALTPGGRPCFAVV